MPALTKIEEIMPKGCFTVDLEDTVHKADEIIRTEHVKSVPVLEGNKFIGFITGRTLIDYTRKNFYDFEDDFDETGRNIISDFEEIIDKNFKAVYPEDSIQKAVEIMTRHHYDCLPVVDWENNLLGIITSNDLLTFYQNRKNAGFKSFA